MIRVPHIWAILGVVVIILAGCKKEIDEFVPVHVPVDFDFTAEFSDVMDTLGYAIEGDDWNILYTPKGTAFILKPGMFEYTDGSDCLCETVSIQIIEVADKRDLLVHNTPTVSDNALLTSAGAYHISASHQGKPLQLVDYEQICFVLPAQELDGGMELFYGSKNQERFNWLPASGFMDSQSYVKKGEWQVDTSVIVGYECFSDKMDWLGVNKYVSDGIANQTCVTLSEFFTGDNTVIYAIANGERSVVRLEYIDSQGFCTQNLPRGTEVRFVGIAKRNTDIYELASESVKINMDHLQTLSFNPISIGDLKTFLSTL